MAGILLILLGLILAIMAHPKMKKKILPRLSNEGIVTIRPFHPKTDEIIKSGGPNLSVFATGFILIFIGLVIFLWY